MPQAPSTIWSTKRLAGKVATRIIPIPCPEVVSGDGCLAEIGSILSRLGCKKPLVVTDEILVKVGCARLCTEALVKAGLSFELYDAVTPNPPLEQVEKGYELYKKGSCDSIVALGGGSPMDCAKVIGAKVANPKDIRSYEGLFKVTWLGLNLTKLPPFVAVPTTAGTGSETTVAAIITLPDEKRKITIADTGLVPRVAVLDPQVLKNCPVPVLAATGMDALTHAVESYLNRWSTAFTRQHSLKAVEKIFRNLLVSCNKGGPEYHEQDVLHARDAMLRASFEAGVAFTRANVGYVHAIAHQLGGLYHTPHGEANAMMLAPVLHFYIKDELQVPAGSPASSSPICSQMLGLAKAAGLASHYEEHTADQEREAARQFVQSIEAMHKTLGMPSQVPKMPAAEVREVARRALGEAHGSDKRGFNYLLDLGYPVPKYMTPEECENMVAEVLPESERAAWDALRSEASKPRSRL